MCVPETWAGLGAAVLLLAIGVFGYVDARSMLDHGIEARSRDGASPDDIARMSEDGGREARIPLQMAGVLAGACAAVLVAGRIRAARR